MQATGEAGRSESGLRSEVRRPTKSSAKTESSGGRCCGESSQELGGRGLCSGPLDSLGTGLWEGRGERIADWGVGEGLSENGEGLGLVGRVGKPEKSRAQGTSGSDDGGRGRTRRRVCAGKPAYPAQRPGPERARSRPGARQPPRRLAKTRPPRPRPFSLAPLISTRIGYLCIQ